MENNTENAFIEKLNSVSDRAIADLNHIIVNSGLNIQMLTDNQIIYDECSKMMEAVKDFTKKCEVIK